ncbi:MAG: TlpA disulfide reductase family protein [Bacteroidota bacterium]
MKRISSLAIALFAVTLLANCSSPTPSKKPAIKPNKKPVSHTVVFSVDNAPLKGKGPKSFFYHHDSLAQTHGISVDSKTANFELNMPVLMLEASQKQTPFLIYPGEHINIRYAGTDSLQMYIPGNAKRTNELDFFRRLVNKTGNVWYFSPSMSYQRTVSNLEQIRGLEQTIHDLKNSRLEFLAAYEKQFPVSEDFSAIAAYWINSTAIRDSLLLYHNNREKLLALNLYRKLTEAKLAGIQQIGFKPYAMFYRTCIDLVSMALSNSKFDIEGIGRSSAEFNKEFDFIEKYFSGLTRDFLLAHLMRSATINQVPVSKTYLEKFDTLCADQGYRDQVHRLLNDNKVAFVYTKGSNKLLSLDGKTVQDLSAVIQEHKGKLIVIDFWASWCSPCREEMPYTAKLKKSFQGRKIVFITISTDTEINGWKKAAKEESLVGSNNYLLLNADQASFIKRYNINAIPRYMLIGKDGKVLSADAPRPSEPKLAALINQNL